MYYNNTDGKQYTEQEIKELHNMSFCSTTISELGYEVIFPTPMPTVTELQVAYQDGTELDSKDNRVVKWSIKDMFSDTEESTKTEQEEVYLLSKFKDTVPKTITPRQLRLALLAISLLDEVEAMVATDRAMGIWWEYSLEVERNNEYVVNAIKALGLTELDGDNLFIAGGKL